MSLTTSEFALENMPKCLLAVRVFPSVYFLFRSLDYFSTEVIYLSRIDL